MERSRAQHSLAQAHNGTDPRVRLAVGPGVYCKTLGTATGSSRFVVENVKGEPIDRRQKLSSNGQISQFINQTRGNPHRSDTRVTS